jgi:hypothetical protein
MNNRILIIIEKISAYIICILVSLFLIATIFDIVNIIKDPTDYRYIIRDTNFNSGIAKYIIKSSILSFCCIILLGLSIWRLVKPNRTLRIIVNITYIALIIVLSIMFYIWYLNGFDHP